MERQSAGLALGERVALSCALIVPIIYFGVQLALAPTYPGYDLLRDPASLLGSDRSPHGALFNAVAIISGLCLGVGVVGLSRALWPPALRRAAVIVLAAVLLWTAFGNVWAGVFPLPDPRHRANPSTAAYILLPGVYFACAIILPRMRRLRLYLAANLVLFLAVFVVMTGIVAVDRAALGGLLQRLLALTTFLPVGVLAAHLLLQARRAKSLHAKI